MTHSIEHSGLTWTMLRFGRHGFPVWPIQEYLIRTKHGPRVRDRIARLNANGKEEGEHPRGWHPEQMRRIYGIGFDSVGKGRFIAKYGRPAFDRIPRKFLARKGRRVAVPMQVIEDLGL